MTTVPLTGDQPPDTFPAMTPIACIMCLVPPDAQQFAVPVAQATILVAPYVLRDRITGAIRAVRERGRRSNELDDADEPREKALDQRGPSR